MFRKRRFRVFISVIGDECHEFVAYAKDSSSLFRKLKKRNWIKYEVELIVKNSTTKSAYFINNQNVIDIYIKPE